MLGSFNQKSLELFQELRSESLFSDFSEGDFYDFTTCIRPDGSAYGTGGKCRKGTEGEAKEPKPSGKTRPKAAIESDMRKLTSSGAMQQRGLTGVKARAEHARLKAELNKPTQKKAETSYKVSQEDVDRTKKIIDGEKQKLQKLNDSIKKNPELGKDPEMQKQRKASEATVKSYNEALAYILDRQAAENK